MTDTSRIIDTLHRIDNNDIPYCILRNFEFAKGGPVYGDVDILAPKTKKNLLEDLLRNDGYYRHIGDTTHQTRYLSYVPEERELITLDIYWGSPTYNGIPFLDGQRVLSNRIKYNGIWVPSDEDLFVELVFHSILNKNHYRNRYQRKLRQLRKSVDESQVTNHARSVFGSKGVKVIKLALDGKLYTALDFKWDLVSSGVINSPFKGWSLFRNLVLLRKIERPMKSLKNRLMPTSTPVIAILGPDGVGKSTTVEQVTDSIEGNGFRVRKSKLGVHSGATKILGTLRSLYNRVQRQNSVYSTEGEQKCQRLGPRSSTLITPILLFDWLLRFISAQTSGADVIVADRYLHELTVYNNPGLLSWFIRQAERGPFYGVVLTGDPNTVAERSEFDAESITKFQDTLRDFDLQVVDTSEGPEAVTDAVLMGGMKIVLEHISNK